MAEILVALEAYAVVEQVHNIYASARDRIEKASRNPQLAQDLADIFGRLVTELAPLAEQCKKNDLKFSEQHLDVFRLRIRELKTTMEKTLTKLQQKIAKLNKPFYRFARARTTSDWLSELEATAHGADQLVFDITACFANANLIDNLTDAVGALNISADEQDSFKPSIEVPENPPHVVLNFAFISDMEGDSAMPLTVEGQLKRAVLRSDGSQNVGAVGSTVGSRSGAVGVRGMSGVGKSCALRGLAKDVEVSSRFQDGIYFMLLGKDATEADVIQRVATIMDSSGSKQMAREAREGTSIDDAVAKARQWFRRRCILLLIDDVWEENDSRRDIIARLSRIVDTERGSRVVFSTRDLRMAARNETICFAARDHADSLQILLAAAGLEQKDVGQSGVIVNMVLEYCGGIPMALAVAGSAINMRLLSTDKSSLVDVWEEYASGLQRCRQRLVKLTVDNDPYTNLESAFRASLEMLDKSRTRKLAFVCKMLFPGMYRALVVLRRQGWVPVSVLHGLWETADVYEAIDVLQELVGASLAQREDRVVDGMNVPGVALHDLQLDFVQAECKEHRELEMWHRKLLRSWLPEEGSSSNRTSFACRSWSKDDVFKDLYRRNNVCRHLIAAGLRDELYSLLRNPEWTAQRLRTHEILSLEEDFRMLLEDLRQGEGKNSESNSAANWSLKMIAGAARLSSPYVSRNPSEVWFQLHARLFLHAVSSEVIRTYRAEIERCAEGPWLKALTPCLPEPGRALQSTMLCDGTVYWISELDGSEKTVACGIDEDGAAFVNTFVKGQAERTVWLSRSDDDASGYSEGTSAGDKCTDSLYEGSDAEDGSRYDSSRVSLSTTASNVVTATCCTGDGTRVVTGHKDGRLQAWNAETGEAIGMPLRGHSSSIRCAAWSADGKHVASGARDGTVRLWDVEKGEAVREPLRGHSESVLCVAWSPEGRRVASGGSDGTVRLWDVEKGEAVGGALQVHSGWVRCVSWSPDGRRVASGGEDDTVRLWDVEKGEAIGDALCGHNSWVKCVAWSADGRRVASGGYDHTVRVWDVDKGEAVGEALLGHSGWVRCVAWPDGRRVASGGGDGTVRLWDVENGEAIGEALRGHSGWVRCVAWSPDERRVASGGEDGSVRLWDVETGGAVGEALHGHSGSVKCVEWSLDGRRVASGGRDGTVRVWDVETGECVARENGWKLGDRIRLRFMLGEEGVKEEVNVRFRGTSVVYNSETILGTLESSAVWEVSDVSRSITAGQRNGTVDFFKVVE